MVLKYTNNARSVLAGSINASQTTISINGPDASKFPVMSDPDNWFPITVVDAGGNMEIMHCTGRSSAVLTVIRGREGTAGIAFAAGASVTLRMTSAAQATFANKADLDAVIAQLAAQSADDVPNVPAGNIAATNVQAAINELDTEKVAKADIDTDTTMTANLDTKVPSQKAVKAYIDAVTQGANFKNGVRCVTTAALATNTRSGNVLTASAAGALTLDGIAPILNERVLINNEATAANNGIYTLTQLGDAITPWKLTRALDMDTWSEVFGAKLWVNEGTLYGDTEWTCTSDKGGTINTTAITFALTQQSVKGAMGGVPGASNKLTVDVTSVTAIAVTADAIAVDNAAGNVRILRRINLTADITTALDTGSEASSTWYYPWVFWNGTTAILRFSASSSAPTLPAGYTHKFRCNGVLNDSSSNLIVSRQRGSKSGYDASRVVRSGPTGAIDTAIRPNFCPPTAVAVDVSASIFGGTDSQSIYVGPSSSLPDTIAIDIVGGNYSGTRVNAQMVLQSNNVRYASSTFGGELSINGWEE